MKKMNMLIGFLLLCGANFIGAMERELIPFSDMHQKQYGTITHEPKYHLLVVAIGQLPRDIQGVIVKKMCDVADEKVFKIPIKLGLKFYDEWCELQKICPLQFGDRVFSAAQLVALSPQKREKFLSMAKPSSFKKLEGASESIVMYDDYNELIEIFPEQEVLRQVRVIPEQSFCKRYIPEIFGGSLFSVGAACGIANICLPELSAVLAPISVVFGIAGPFAAAVVRYGYKDDLRREANYIV